jgi:hypothetical protein
MVFSFGSSVADEATMESGLFGSVRKFFTFVDTNASSTPPMLEQPEEISPTEAERKAFEKRKKKDTPLPDYYEHEQASLVSGEGEERMLSFYKPEVAAECIELTASQTGFSAETEDKEDEEEEEEEEELREDPPESTSTEVVTVGDDRPDEESVELLVASLSMESKAGGTGSKLSKASSAINEKSVQSKPTDVASKVLKASSALSEKSATSSLGLGLLASLASSRSLDHNKGDECGGVPDGSDDAPTPAQEPSLSFQLSGLEDIEIKSQGSRLIALQNSGSTDAEALGRAHLKELMYHRNLVKQKLESPRSDVESDIESNDLSSAAD